MFKFKTKVQFVVPQKVRGLPKIEGASFFYHKNQTIINLRKSAFKISKLKLAIGEELIKKGRFRILIVSSKILKVFFFTKDRIEFLRARKFLRKNLFFYICCIIPYVSERKREVREVYIDEGGDNFLWKLKLEKNKNIINFEKKIKLKKEIMIK